jgi:hypothetical protein
MWTTSCRDALRLDKTPPLVTMWSTMKQSPNRNPRGSDKDIDELIQLWSAYSSLKTSTRNDDKRYRETISNGYYHSNNDNLRAFERRFVRLVPKAVPKLIKILSSELGRPSRSRRATAAFLLSWHSRTQGRQVSAALLSAF